MKTTLFTIISIFIIISCCTSRWNPTTFKDHDELETTTPKEEDKIVIMYSTSWCYWCKVAKGFLKEHEITFLERNYEDPQIIRSLKQFADNIGYTERLDAVPIFIIGKKILIGYNPKQILCEIGREKCNLKLFTTWESPLRQ
tara:strand:- start:4260 stop:4685 length:426 start_codon:yes stop_codon:yes gene_type:complete